MNQTISRLGRTLTLIAMGGAVALMAQSTSAWDPFMKIRAQYGFKSDQGQQGGFGVGFGANHKLGGGTLGLEVGYHFVPGQLVRGDIPANSLGEDQSNSVFTKKHSTEMLGFRVSYGMPLNSDWNWHVGVGLYHSKNRLETIGTFTAQGTDGVWNTVVNESGLSYAPFVGVIWNINDAGSLELNLVYMNYKRTDVAPVFNATAADYARVTPVYSSPSYGSGRLELGYTFHF